MSELLGKQLGRWTLEREIGRGGMGRVYLGHDQPAAGQEATVTYAAIKVLAPELSQEPGFLERFQREIEVLRKLNHPHIVRLYDSGLQDGHYYYAMEHLKGENFEDILEKEGRLPWKQVIDVALQVCPALKHAHDHGIIHRDLKPQNLIRTEDGQVKLTDFGIAKVFASRQLTITGGLVGTAEYLSPEQAAGKPVTHRSDLYSFGCVLYVLLTGRPPFQGRSTLDLMHKHRFGQFDAPQRIVTDMPNDLNKIICELLEKEPAHRPANGLVLLRELESLQRKVERREQHTIVSGSKPGLRDTEEESDHGEGNERPGPATLMSQLVRAELDASRRAGPIGRLLSQPLVLVTLLAGCLALIAYAIWFQPRDLVPSYGGTRSASEAERIFDQGTKLAQTGDFKAAQQRWQDLVSAFADVESAQRWVNQAQQRLSELKALPAEDPRWRDVHQALSHIHKLALLGKRDEAEARLKALERLYESDPAAGKILEKVRSTLAE